jgi:hypothetical protein
MGELQKETLQCSCSHNLNSFKAYHCSVEIQVTQRKSKISDTGAYASLHFVWEINISIINVKEYKVSKINYTVNTSFDLNT